MAEPASLCLLQSDNTTKNDINFCTASSTTSFPGGDGLTKVTPYYLYKLNNDDGNVHDDDDDHNDDDDDDDDDGNGDGVGDSDDPDNDV